MKKIIQNNKIIYAIIGIIIIVAAVMIVTMGFNYELKFNENKSIEINLKEQFQIEEIKKITKEVFKDKKVIVEYVEEFKDTVYITTNEITEEEKSAVIQKINEKYSLEYVAEDFAITTNKQTKVIDIVKNSIMPLVWTSVIVIVYFICIYRKIGVINVIVKSIMVIILSQILLFSLYVITRYPIGITTLTLIIATYIISITCLITKFEKEKRRIKQENKKI